MTETAEEWPALLKAIPTWPSGTGLFLLRVKCVQALPQKISFHFTTGSGSLNPLKNTVKSQKLKVLPALAPPQSLRLA